MKRAICISISMACVLFVSCGRDYKKAIIGTWDAGKATQESRIIVTIKDHGLLTASITNTEMKPISGTYRVEGDGIEIKLSGMTLAYKIMTLDEDKLVMSSDTAKITWIRLK
jgi:hypothetical protein